MSKKMRAVVMVDLEINDFQSLAKIQKVLTKLSEDFGNKAKETKGTEVTQIQSGITDRRGEKGSGPIERIVFRRGDY